jgi:hypothetical protein
MPRQSRMERARRCYTEARFELEHIRWLRSGGVVLSDYLPKQAVTQARYLVWLGRKLQYTNERVQLPRDLGMYGEER